MSERKHTPLPWWVDSSDVFGEANEDALQLEICGNDQYIAKTIGGVGELGEDSLEVEMANAKLIVASVNVRPKVEQLLEMLNNWSDEGIIEELEPPFGAIYKKAREVSAALGGKAE